MPTPAEHLAKAEENEKVYALLSAQFQHFGWQGTLLFYAALHYADAYLHHVGAIPAGRHLPSHRHRSALIETRLGTALKGDFTDLQHTGEDARYDSVVITAADVAALDGGPYTRIRTYVRTALGLTI